MSFSDFTSYYLGLLAIQVTLLTLVAAGTIALYQIYNQQSPKRDFSVVISKRQLMAYLIFAFILLLLTASFAWLVSGEHNVITFVNFNSGSVACSSLTRFLIIFFTLVMCFIFFFLLWKSRTILDTKLYLRRLEDSIDIDQISDYLFHTYSSKPSPYFYLLSFVIGVKKPNKKKESEKKKKAKDDARVWQDRYDKTVHTTNPLLPYIDYCRNNASSSSGDVEAVGLPILERLIIKYMDSGSADACYVPNYIADTIIELKEAFIATSLPVRKRCLDMLFNIANKYCIDRQFDQMTSVAQQMYHFIRGVLNEDLKLYTVKKLKILTDNYVSVNKKEKDWRKFDDWHQELALVVARLAENHYHNINDLTPISIIENNRTETHDLSEEIVNYFTSYIDLNKKYSDYFPVIFFDAVDVSAEALMGAMSMSNAIKNNIGLTASKYKNIVGSFYYIFYDYARFGIKGHNVDLIRNCVFRLMHGLKFMSEKGINDCALDVADVLISLGLNITCTPTLRDETTFGSNLITDEIIEAVNKYGNHEELLERRSSIEHDLLFCLNKPEARIFEERIGWY